MVVIQSVSQNRDNCKQRDDTERMRKAAIGYAQLLNWHVFPVHSIANGKCTCNDPNCKQIAKHPITNNGFKDATVNLNQINQWWTKYPGANIAIRTGKESRIFVLDVDTKGANGKETLERLIEEHGPLPDTVQAITGSGGMHYLFKYVDGIGNKVNFQPSLDIRGDGGYIVAPMSTHASGNRYEWELSSRPIENEIAEAPQWLVDMIKEPPNTNGRFKPPIPSSHWQKLMQGLSEGEGRNPAATSIVGHLLSKNVDLLLVYEMMHLWNERNNPPLEVEELNTVIASIAKKDIGRGRRGR